MRILAILIIIYLASIASAFEVSQSNPGQGDQIVITGTASPGENVKFQSSFKMVLPVDAGRYEYEASRIEIPQKPNSFAVSANGIKDLNVGVKFGVWITKGFQASNGAAHISQSDVPSGRYDLKVFGEAAQGAASIPIEITAGTQVTAGPDGKYSLTIDTTGLPAGEYVIRGPDQAKTLQVGVSRSSSGGSDPGTDSKAKSSESVESSSGSVSSSAPRQAEKAATAVDITSEVIKWYAVANRLDPEKPDQYAEAERRLKLMTSGGTWKVIARGSPLTEQAGNCQDQYCLVRGIGACTICRDKEMVLYLSRSSGAADENKSLNRTENIAKPSVQGVSESKAPARADRGFISWILEILQRIFGIRIGG